MSYNSRLSCHNSVPFMAQWLTNQTRIQEDMGSIPGHPQWFKDPTLPRAVVWVTDAARIPRCCCAVAGVQASSCSSNSTPSLGTSIHHGHSPKKKTKKNPVFQRELPRLSQTETPAQDHAASKSQNAITGPEAPNLCSRFPPPFFFFTFLDFPFLFCNLLCHGFNGACPCRM